MRETNEPSLFFPFEFSANSKTSTCSSESSMGKVRVLALARSKFGERGLCRSEFSALVFS